MRAIGFVDVFGGAVYLLGKPSGSAALAGKFGFEELANVKVVSVLWRVSFHGIGRLVGLPPLSANHEERRSPFVSLLIILGALVNLDTNKHEKVCAIKRKLSACLFSCRKIYQIFQERTRA